MGKQILLTALLIIAGLSCYSQIVFEEGYFIDETGHRIDCLIKNVNWKNNPDGFEYKLHENTEIKRTGIQDAKEFGIDSISKYVRASVQIDRSSDKTSYLDDKREPVFHEEQLFLKVLIEGKASLYMYEDEGVKRFFYKKEDSEIKQLVYKRYVLNDDRIIENNKFRQQLFFDLKCPGIHEYQVESLSYDKNELYRFFIDYCECTNTGFISYKRKSKRDFFNLTVRPGVSMSSLSISNYLSDSRDIKFDNSITFRFGLEAEFILPFNKNKWSVIAEPTYQNYRSEKKMEEGSVYGGILTANVDYKSIELPLGIRHYFYFKNGNKAFLNVFYIMDYAVNSTIVFSRDDYSFLNSLEPDARNNLAIGAGYKFKEKYCLELRYQTEQDVLCRYIYYYSGYTTISVILGYTLF